MDGLKPLVAPPGDEATIREIVTGFEKERSSAQNVARKMQAGATFPIYAAPGVDLTKEVTEALNKRYRQQQKKKDD